MRKKYLFYSILVVIGISAVSWLMLSGYWQRTKAMYLPKKPIVSSPTQATSKRMKIKAAEAKTYVTQKGLNTELCLLIDMSLHSGTPRLFVYHFNKDSVINSGLVTHGRCNETWLEGRRYSNVPGSGCTSLGRYKTGYAYQGRFGLAYKLHGLDKTNNKAFERYVVLHAHECVPETGVSDAICQSDGCPTVSPGFLQYLRPIIDKSPKPVLLWIYE